MKQTVTAQVEATRNKLQMKAGARGFRIIFDEPEDAGGADTGMNPVEGLLCSLGACNAIATIIFAGMEGVALDSLQVDLEGDIDTDGFLGINPDVRNGFQEVRFSVRAKGADEEAIRTVLETAERQCPVSDCIKNPVPVVCTEMQVN